MKKYILLSLIATFFLINTGCFRGNCKKFKTGKDIYTKPEISALIEKGDKEFYKMHWVGWTNAIKIYTGILELKDSFEIRRKLFFSLLLRAERSSFLALSGVEDIKVAEALLPELIKKEKNLQQYYRIVNCMVCPTKPSVFTCGDLITLKSDLNRDYKYYLYLMFIGRYCDFKEYRKNVENMMNVFLPDSNFKYFLRDIFIEIDMGLRKYPDFIELLLRRGDRFFNTGKLRKAEEYYLRILKFNKNVPYALTGLGGIYLSYELYSRALDFYNRSGKIISLYYKNLFGKAVCLSQMAEYRNSIDVLDIMIENKLPYLGEAYYYRAFNNFILKEYSKVESDLKNSEKYIWDSLELNTLFGMFYYKTGREKKSVKYFKKAIQINPEYPRPYYYLGFLDANKNNINGSIMHFSLAGKFYLKMIKGKIKNIKNLKDRDLSSVRKKEIREKRIKRVKQKIKEIIRKLNNVILMFKKLHREKIEFLFHAIEELKVLMNLDSHNGSGSIL